MIYIDCDKQKREIIGEKNTTIAEFGMLYSTFRKYIEKEDMDKLLKLFEDEFQSLNENKEKIKKCKIIEVHANSKVEAISQIQKLRLPKEIEQEIINRL